MRQIQTDLWETDVESPFPGLTTHAYLLTRDDGNVLFYNTGHHHEIDGMAELGGVAHQLLSHQDELGETLVTIHQRFGATLGGHVREREVFAKIRDPDVLFDHRETILNNIEVIPTPGHTPGSTCFQVLSPSGKRYLFTGDTLFLSESGEWRAGYIKGVSDREELARSVRLLGTLRPDVVISSAFGGTSGFREETPESWAGAIENALKRLR
jgi:glyoxylase-like metal-dependent hydrolase (beta-lactamase superfamily II)